MRPIVAELFCADEWTRGRMDMTKPQNDAEACSAKYNIPFRNKHVKIRQSKET